MPLHCVTLKSCTICFRVAYNTLLASCNNLLIMLKELEIATYKSNLDNIALVHCSVDKDMNLNLLANEPMPD